MSRHKRACNCPLGCLRQRGVKSKNIPCLKSYSGSYDTRLPQKSGEEVKRDTREDWFK